VIQALAERSEEGFRRSVLETAQRMESELPRLRIEVVESRPHDKQEDDDGGDDVTFSAADLRKAFGGNGQEWDQIVKQEDPEIQAFLAKRGNDGKVVRVAQAEPPLKKGSSKKVPKNVSASAEKHAVAVAPKRKMSESAINQAAPEKKAAVSKLGSPAEGGKRQRRFWGHEEELDLVKGIRKYGKGSWRKIMQDETLKFHERSATDLKDKWRNLEKKKGEYEKELDLMEDVEEDGLAVKKQGKGSNKREPVEEIEDSDDVVAVKPIKKEPVSKKQALSPSASSIRESALEARNKRLRQINNEK
jgi:hypothetical protein